MKRVKTKQKSKKKYYVSQKQLDRVAKETAHNAVRNAVALVLAATHDTLGLTAEQARQIKKTTDRYCDYLMDGTINEELPIKTLKSDGIELRFVLAEGEDE